MKGNKKEFNTQHNKKDKCEANRENKENGMWKGGGWLWETEVNDQYGFCRLRMKRKSQITGEVRVLENREWPAKLEIESHNDREVRANRWSRENRSVE